MTTNKKDVKDSLTVWLMRCGELCALESDLGRLYESATNAHELAVREELDQEKVLQLAQFCTRLESTQEKLSALITDLFKLNRNMDDLKEFIDFQLEYNYRWEYDFKTTK